MVSSSVGTFCILRFADGREDNYVYVSEAFLAGIAAGALEAVISTPFELLKLRAQVTAAVHPPASSSVKANQVNTLVIARLLRGCTLDKKAWDHTIELLSTLSNKHPNMISALKDYPWMLTGSGRPPAVYDVKRPLSIISLEGWDALWRGLRPSIVRDSIFGGIFFSSWQFLHIQVLEQKAIGMNPPPRFYFILYYMMLPDLS